MKLPRLRHNIAALGAMQIANYLIPMVTLPYLTRTLGVESYGKVVLVQAVMAYFILLVDFGFSWSTTRKIAAHRGNHQFIANIFSATWAAQWLLALVSSILLLVSVVAIPFFNKDANLYLMGMLLIVGNVLFPLWLLQGLERMREVALIQVVSRVVFLPLVFILVRDTSDTLLAVALVGMSPVLAGVMSLVWIKRNQLVEFERPVFSAIVQALREGSGLFLSRITISSYTILTPVILGTVAGTTALAYFNLADKARNAAQSALSPISQALYPRMSHLYKNDPASANMLLRRSMLAVFLIAGGISTFLWFFSDLIILILGGSKFGDAAGVLKWLALLPLIIGFSNILGVQIMLPNNMNKSFNTILIGAGVISLVVIWPLVRHNGAVGAAQTFFATELFVTFCMGTYLWNKGYLNRNFLGNK